MELKKGRKINLTEALQAPDLKAGRWVMKGEATKTNYALTGLWGPRYDKGAGLTLLGYKKYPPSNHITGAAKIGRPNGWNAFRGIFEQRVIIR